MAISVYDQNEMSEQDRKLLEVYKKEYASAHAAGDTAGMKSANQRAEALRASYGYSGGSDGSQYNPIAGYEGVGEAKKAGENLNSAYSGIADAYKSQADAQKADIDRQKYEMQKQAYITNEQQKRNLDQTMRASGVTGGLSETSRVQLQQNYATNRNAAATEAMKSKREIDLALQQNLAQNELNRANAKYSSDMANAQLWQSAANNNRTISQQEFANKLSERQLELTEKQFDLTEQQNKFSNYMTYLQSGLIDETNAKEIASTLGTSEASLLAVSRAAQNGDYQAMVLNLLNAGVYDDSFVDILGGRFSAQTLKTFATKNNAVLKAASSGASSSPSGILKSSNSYNDITSNVTDEIKEKSASFTSNTALASYLDGLADSGTITQAEADSLYARYNDINEKYADDGSVSYSDMIKSNSGWEVINDGGVNWFWGIDNNAIVKSPNGEQIRLDNLLKKLKEEGMSDSKAKEAIKTLQKNLDI